MTGRDFQLGFFGVFGCGNFGNDATLDACIAGVRPSVPAAKIMCIAANPARISSAYGIDSFPITLMPSLAGGGGGILGSARRVIGELGNLARAWRLLRRTRTLVIAGTGVLDDQHVTPTQLPLEVFRWSLAARLARARLVFLSVGAGPIDQSYSRLLLTQAVKYANDVSYRDQRSLEFMRSIGRDVTSDRVLPDLAFAKAPPDVAHTDRTGSKRRLAIGLLGRANWSGRLEQYRRYEDQLVQIIVTLANEGWEMRLVTGDEVDVDTQHAVISRPEVAGLAVIPEETHSFDDVVAVLGGCDAMLASRYHNIVAAVIAGVPVISLGYGPKNIALLEQLQMAERGHDIDNFSVETVVQQIRDARRGGGVVYRPQVDHYRHLLHQELDALVME